MLTYKKILLLNFILIFAIAFTLESIAQPARKAGHRMQTIKKIQLLDVLDLNQNESDKLISLINSLDDNIRNKAREYNMATQKLEEIINDNASEKDLKKQIDEVQKAHQEMHKAVQYKFSEIQKVLSTENYAKFLVFENRFNFKLRESMFRPQQGDEPPGLPEGDTEPRLRRSR